MSRRKYGLTPEDLQAWEQLARTTRPFDRAGRGAPPAPPLPPEAAAGRPADPSPSPPPPVPPAGPAGARMRPPALGDLRSGHLVDMDGRTAGRLKRGRLDIDGRIDLHGMTQESAHAALRGFLRRGREQGWRCVLVITGKGGRSGDSGTGVLRRAVPMWLNGVDLRPLVVGFINATPRHGGEGALYVMLRRRRESGP